VVRRVWDSAVSESVISPGDEAVTSGLTLSERPRAFTAGRALTGIHKAWFFAGLAFVTALPLFGLGFGVGLTNPNGPHSPVLLAALLPIIAATGYGHVASTAYLYADRGFWPLIRQNWARFVFFPALAVLVWGGAYRLGPAAAGVTKLIFFVWLLYHYQRQNYGVIAFAAQDRKLGPLPKGVQAILNLSVAGGICTMLARPDLLAQPIFRVAGIGLFAAATVVLGHLLMTNRRIATDPLVAGFTVLGWAFFLPTLMSRDLLVCFTPFAIAHGAQYLLFVAVISGGSGLKWGGPVIMGATTFGTWWLFTRLLGLPGGAAMLNGITIGHFVADAKIWRMREPMQRQLIRQRFGFLFS
jgi:hypothetical protein